MKQSEIFVIENNLVEANAITNHFKNYEEYHFVVFKNSDECIKQLHKHPLAVIVDYDMNSINASLKDSVLIIDEIKKIEHFTEVIMLSSVENVEIAIDTIKHGAFDYIIKGPNMLHRLENELQAILELVDNKKSLKTYKNITLIGGIIIIIYTIVVIYLAMTGSVNEGNAGSL